MKIIGIESLKERIAEYSEMFPENHLTLEDIEKSLQHEYEEYGSHEGLGEFGYSVSKEWEDKCYTFKYVTDSPELNYEFVGMMKC